MKKYHNLLLLVLFLCFSLKGFSQRYTSEIFSYLNIEVESDVLYGQNYERVSLISPNVEMKELRMDIYQPKQSVDTVSERPLMIYLHTGNFLNPPQNGAPTGLKTDLTAVEICRQFARRGYVAASIYYRLNWNPATTNADTRKTTLLQAVFRAIIDAKTAVRYFRKSHAENNNPYNIDPNKIMLFGEGSGGYVALAHATLDKQSEIELTKFLDAGGDPVLETSVIGGFDGFGGSENYDNHVGYSADVQLIVNIGGSLADTSWMEPGDPPMVAFQCVRDPFAPYLDGTVVVPTTNENVVDVQGAGVFMKKAVAVGNNAVFDTANLNDPITQIARSRYDQTVDHWGNAPDFEISVAGDEGLMPFLLPLAPSGAQFDNQSSPWQFWDPNSDLANKPSTEPGLTTHESALQSNPDMSREKALRYIDTIQWYLQPRAVLALDLDTTTTYKDSLAGIPDPTTVVGLKDIPLKEVNMRLYPNPASETVVLQLNDNELKMES
ncbi:MAG: alpha/beta hydrolase, partial [Chitinophagales bacterium]